MIACSATHPGHAAHPEHPEPLHAQGVARAERQVIAWFEVADHAAFAPDRFPVFILQDERGGMFYGFPEFGGSPGLKVGKFYHLFEACEDPDKVSREITPEDEEVGPCSQLFSICTFLLGSRSPCVMCTWRCMRKSFKAGCFCHLPCLLSACVSLEQRLSVQRA